MGTSRYSGTEKAAILLLGLGEEVAAEIFKQLSEAEIKKIAAAMHRLREVDQRIYLEVLKEFEGQLQTKGNLALKGGPEFVRAAIGKAFAGERADQLTRNIVRGETRLESLELVDGETLAGLIQKEHPQTIALILAHADAKKCGEALKHLPQAMHTDLIFRIANLQAVTPEEVEALDNHLREIIEARGALFKNKVGGVNKAAAILNAIDKQSESVIMEQISELDPDLSEKIRAEMFVFDDLVHLTARDMQELLKVVPQPRLVLALKTASEPVREMIFKNMSERAAKLLREDLEAAPRVKISDVESAQQEILAAAKKLEDEGKISLKENKEQYV